MKITKESILSLGFVVEFENPVGFRFFHPNFHKICYVFWNKSQTISLSVLDSFNEFSLIEFETIKHFTTVHKAISQPKLKIQDISLCDPNTRFCINQK
jgi:hypothetical protein